MSMTITADTLPEPLLPPNVDLSDFSYMPLDVERLRRSRSWRIEARKHPELGFYMMNLWSASWHETPAGSLEDDDEMLADLAMCPLKKWIKVRETVLRGWKKCSDGRLYHPVVCEKALEAWEIKKKRIHRAKSGAAARWGQAIDIPTSENASSIPKACLSDAKAMLGDAKGREGNRREEKNAAAESPESPIPARARAPAEAASAASAKRYAFEGGVIRLERADFDRWRQKYWSIPDLSAELSVIDDKARDWPEADKRRWFGKVSGWLCKRHNDLVAAGATRQPVDPDSEWLDRLQAYRRPHPFWIPEWGPEPGKPGCQAPARVLKKYNILPASPPDAAPSAESEQNAAFH
jgi:hypothetical protein